MGNNPDQKFSSENYNSEDALLSNRRRSDSIMAIGEKEEETLFS